MLSVSESPLGKKRKKLPPIPKRKKRALCFCPPVYKAMKKRERKSDVHVRKKKKKEGGATQHLTYRPGRRGKSPRPIGKKVRSPMSYIPSA